MARKKLFIIGAGASKQLDGFVTGVELIEKIKSYFLEIEPQKNPARSIYCPRSTWEEVDFYQLEKNKRKKVRSYKGDDIEEGKELIKWLSKDSDITNEYQAAAILSILIKQHNPDSIDYFLQNLKDYFFEEYESDNVTVEKVQKEGASIVQNIIRGIQENSNYFSVKQNFYFWDILKSVEKDIDNIDIINFNYDTLLEESCKDFSSLRTDKVIFKEFQKKLEDSHIYGDIKKGISFIRVIEERKIDQYSKLFNNADDVYFLGFGFDKLNLDNLGVKKFERLPSKKIYITNYKASRNIIHTIENYFNIDLQKENYFNTNLLKGIDSRDGRTIYISPNSVEKAIKEDFLI